ncbi:hypothetical protein K2D_35050 [Planctomycetes bacterium K2D]|nr:hypothetical protein K2D_35050 [Planctomycetes bacterium K2D]
MVVIVGMIRVLIVMDLVIVTFMVIVIVVIHGGITSPRAGPTGHGRVQRCDDNATGKRDQC